MKKAIVYTVLPALLMTLAAGCGTANGDQRLPSASPVISASPVTVPTPDMGDGAVNDRDGIITPGDNGMSASPNATTRPGKSAAPNTTTRPGRGTPGASPSATPDM